MSNTKEERKAFEEAISNMSLVASPFFNDYVFYMHLISQCRVIFKTTLPAAAGVTFKHDHYILYINPLEVIAEGIDKDGKPVKVQGFSEAMPLKHRIGILKHEMLHIALGHMIRVEDRDFNRFNYAADCALNQEIYRGPQTTVNISIKNEVKTLLADPKNRKRVENRQFKNIKELYLYLNLGRKATAETKAKMSKAALGKPASEIAKKKTAAATKGKENSQFLGYCIYKNEYYVSTDLAEKLNISVVAVNNMCRKRNKKPITSQSYTLHRYLKNHHKKEEVLGKTWNDLGFDFIAKDEYDERH